MEKGLLFFTLAVGAFWLILDEFYGAKRISNIASQLTPTSTNPIKDFMGWKEATPEEKEKTYKQTLDKIDKNKGIKTDKAKDAVKDMVTDFYLKSGGMVQS